MMCGISGNEFEFSEFDNLVFNGYSMSIYDH